MLQSMTEPVTENVTKSDGVSDWKMQQVADSRNQCTVASLGHPTLFWGCTFEKCQGYVKKVKLVDLKESWTIKLSVVGKRHWSNHYKTPTYIACIYKPQCFTLHNEVYMLAQCHAHIRSAISSSHRLHSRTHSHTWSTPSRRGKLFERSHLQIHGSMSSVSLSNGWVRGCKQN